MKYNCKCCEFNCDGFCEARDGYVKTSSNPDYCCDDFELDEAHASILDQLSD